MPHQLGLAYDRRFHHTDPHRLKNVAVPFDWLSTFMQVFSRHYITYRSIVDDDPVNDVRSGMTENSC